MTPRIETITPKTLVGLQIRMNLANNKTSELWRTFLQRKEEIHHRTNTDRYSIQVFDSPQHMNTFTPLTEFDKWAAVEVNDATRMPQGMKSITIEAGQYAVFIHHGAAHTFQKTFDHIFGVWLPASGYQFDHRPQFEIMKADYNPFDDNAQEEVWIPIKQQR
ncbi:MAG: GyrI-like domain-containing protein [Cyclobacteriaceae bacterium]